MDFCRNVTLSGEYYLQDHRVPASPPVSGSKLDASLAVTSPLDDLFPAQNTEGDVSLEWLSVFVEDCLSSTGNCALPAPTSINVQATTPPKPAETLKQKPQQEEEIIPTSFQKFIIPVKARSKRKRVTSVKTRRNPLTSCWSYCPSSDPPLLQQTHWLADSELIVPNKGIIDGEVQSRKEKEYEEEEEGGKVLLISSGKAKDSSGIFLETNNDDDGVQQQQQQQQPRRCTHCLSQRTPQWRAGPLGPKTLCNACGVRYKSGRLLPEYRPAKSPTFVSYLHSNSHKKVMEMRMATSSLFKS